jgi:hypothetical protein
MRISWVHPDLAARVRATLIAGRRSWEDTLTDAGVVAMAPPPGVAAAIWPAVAEHVARAERVREVVAQAGLDHADGRFGDSPHAIERAALAEALAASAGHAQDPARELRLVRGVLSCTIDEMVAYGHFQSRLIELGTNVDPEGTVATIEAFVAAAADVTTSEPSWRERLDAAWDGLASLYVRVGRAADAEVVWSRRFTDAPSDTAVAISAARAFLEAGVVSRAVAWLERGATRAQGVGRKDLAQRLAQKADNLRGRLS